MIDFCEDPSGSSPVVAVNFNSPANKTFEQWGNIFTDNIMAQAILDIIVHHATIFKINGPSYRDKNIQEETLD